MNGVAAQRNAFSCAWGDPRDGMRKRLDGTKRLRYVQGEHDPQKRRIHMRRLMSLLIALGLLLAVAGTALAECSADHPDTAKPTTTKPQPQT